MNHARVFVVAGLLGLPLVGSAALAAIVPVAAAPAESKSAEGSIKSVSGDSFVLSVGVGNDKKDVTVTVNADTKYTLDGKASTKSDALMVGHHAKVTHTNNVASKVDAKMARKP